MQVKKQAQKRWPDRILALAYGAASFSGSGSVGCRGVPVSQMRKEAVKQFGAGRVVLVEEFRTSRVSSAYSSPSEALPGQPPESFRWLRPVYSKAKRSQVRGLMSSTSHNIRLTSSSPEAEAPTERAGHLLHSLHRRSAIQPPATACGLQLQAAASQGIPDWSGSQDRRSMKRHLDQRLYLLVKQQMQGARHPWHFPHSKLQAEETLRAAAERVLVSVMGRQYPVFFIGNAPMAWLPLLPSGGRIFFMLAQVVDDPWGPINLVPDSGALDWAWVTRREATAEYFKDARMAELLGRMLPE
ncbi:hypothetical protein QJQ45_011970 [Haematococcus lacustris]|nr:hypothetical protein QJQ45_011970 [Haematococcus lacustris]